ncbi:hypothetical protein AVDCRST_MAG81-377 [uncultured Synechococcales cyanobacterium]|uniref:Uncharacterized protein n=1 Tax=uncultured Synechococcales cyanobacterium TaxID=1936017 RepID=A0A6J4USK0_9CYAN|nr:hypothetical protein AVDCRST_MAG81-377 [uncultured Synechococcales cyanobacterium]
MCLWSIRCPKLTWLQSATQSISLLGLSIAIPASKRSDRTAQPQLRGTISLLNSPIILVFN